MRILIMSDIHGAYEEIKNIIKKEAFDKIVILGDLLPYSYSYESNLEENILNLLSKYKERLVLIKGNCDRYINYESYGLYAHEEISLTINNHIITFTHGNLYNKGFLPKYHGDIFISGHTHIPVLYKEQDIIYANPGSILMPRAGSNKCYLIIEENKLILKDISGIIIKEMII